MDITVNKSTDHSITLNYKNTDGTARSLVGASVLFTAKPNKWDTDSDDSEALIVKLVTSHSNASNGETIIELTDVDTNLAPSSYFYDIVVVESDSKKYRAAQGTLTILAGVTNRSIS